MVKREWFFLEPLALGLSYLWFILWWHNSYQSSEWLATAILLSMIWLTFMAADIYGTAKSRWEIPDLHLILAATAGILYYSVLAAVLVPHSIQSMTLASILVLVVYAGATFFAFRNTRFNDRTVAVYSLVRLCWP